MLLPNSPAGGGTTPGIYRPAVPSQGRGKCFCPIAQLVVGPPLAYTGLLCSHRGGVSVAAQWPSWWWVRACSADPGVVSSRPGGHTYSVGRVVIC